MPEFLLNTPRNTLHEAMTQVLAGASAVEKRPALRAFNSLMAEHWLILPDALDQMAQIALRLNGDPEAVAAKLGRPLDNARTVTIRDRVAVVPVTGPIFRYADMFTQISGATAVQTLVKDLNEAADSAAVDAIVLEIDSPGGQAAGIADLASIVRGIDKPVTAYVDHQAGSAAYWIAAAADEIVISRTALLGSVGVIVSANAQKREGQVEIISTQSPKKRPDISTESGKAQVQTIVDDLAAVFVADVAQLRGIEQDAVLAWEGDMLVGQKAVDAGMADRLGDFESVIAGLTGSTVRNFAMTAKANSSPEITRESFAAEHPAIADALRAEGRNALASDADALLALPVVAEAVANARTAGATAERERIQSVEAQGRKLPGFAALVDGLKYDGKTTGPEAAVALLEANGQKTAKAAADMRAETPAPLPAVSAELSSQAVDDNAPVEDRCKAQWDADPAIRAEFGTLDAFTAYTRAEESGRVRRIGGKQK